MKISPNHVVFSLNVNLACLHPLSQLLHVSSKLVHIEGFEIHISRPAIHETLYICIQGVARHTEDRTSDTKISDGFGSIRTIHHRHHC